MNNEQIEAIRPLPAHLAKIAQSVRKSESRPAEAHTIERAADAINALLSALQPRPVESDTEIESVRGTIDELKHYWSGNPGDVPYNLTRYFEHGELLLQRYDRLTQELAQLKQPRPVEVDEQIEAIRRRADSKFCGNANEFTHQLAAFNEAVDAAGILLSAYDRLAQENERLRHVCSDNNDRACRAQLSSEKLAFDVDRLQQQIAEMQPRDEEVVAEEYATVKEIRDSAEIEYPVSKLKKLLRYYDRRGVELARWNGTHHGWQCELDRVKAERDKAMADLAHCEKVRDQYVKLWDEQWHQASGATADCARLREALQECARIAGGSCGHRHRPNSHFEIEAVCAAALATQGNTEGK